MKDQAQRLSVSVCGSGYVGCVSAACLANDGFRVIAVDVLHEKADQLNHGLSPVHEPALAGIIRESVANKRLSATVDYEAAINETDVTLVCVGTPSNNDGTLNIDDIRTVSEQIGAVLSTKTTWHTVVIRSTILPGTMHAIVVPALEQASGKTAGVDFGLAYYPEFLREGTAIADYYAPGAVVYGKYNDDERSIEVLRQLNFLIDVEPHVISLESAEIVKYANNCWHAVKISFANEIGNLCKAAKIDSHIIMDVLCADTRLNVSRAYMKPGFAYGGSCLPKDLRALRAFGRSHDVSTPMLDATVRVNEIQLERAFNMVKKTGARKLGMIGLTFKPNTDDLRESPLVALAERLVGAGHTLSIYDPNVSGEHDGNQSSVEHLAPSMVSSPSEAARSSDVLILGNSGPESIEALSSIDGSDKVVIDLARVAKPGAVRAHIDGICW
ncbi:MAG: nucleotide sugar dehydrogenase [Pseudomonadota bacterium]